MAYTKTTWVDNSLPSINATNLNNIENGIEANDTAITNLKTYSTTETNTGQLWIDDKPIYRKVFTGTSISTLDTGLTTVDNVIKMEMLIKGSGTSGSWRNIPWLFNSTDTTWMGGFYFNPSNGNISFQIGSSLSSISKYIIILEYTKTS